MAKLADKVRERIEYIDALNHKLRNWDDPYMQRLLTRKVKKIHEATIYGLPRRVTQQAYTRNGLYCRQDGDFWKPIVTHNSKGKGIA